MKIESKKLLVGTATFIAILAVALLLYNWLSETISPEQHIPTAADFTVIDREDNEVHFFNRLTEGRPIVLNFWASWCPPCRAGMPNFNIGYQEFGEEITFMMVNLTDGRRETKESAIEYIDGEGYTFPIYFDTERLASMAYYVQGIPVTFFINRDGDVVNVVTGQMSESVLRAEIERIQ